MEHLFADHIRALGAVYGGGAHAYPPHALRLDANELPFPPSPRVLHAMQAAAQESNRYPAIGSPALREALSHYTGVDTSSIMVGNGSDEVIELLLKATLNPQDEVIIPEPTFVMYRQLTRIVGGVPVEVARKENYEIDVDAIVQAVTPRTKIIFIATPNNPTGTLARQDVFRELLDRTSCIIVSDECYYEVCRETSAPLLAEYERLLVVRSFSKSFGLAGLRIGYALGNQKLIGMMESLAQPYHVNCVAQAAALAALEEVDTLYTRLDEIVRERDKLAEVFTSLGLEAIPSTANFMCVRTTPWKVSAAQVVEALQQRGIFVRNAGPSFGGTVFRIGIGTPAQNRIVGEALRAIREELAEQRL